MEARSSLCREILSVFCLRLSLLLKVEANLENEDQKSFTGSGGHRGIHPAPTKAQRQVVFPVILLAYANTGACSAQRNGLPS